MAISAETITNFSFGTALDRTGRKVHFVSGKLGSQCFLGKIHTAVSDMQPGTPCCIVFQKISKSCVTGEASVYKTDEGLIIM